MIPFLRVAADRFCGATADGCRQPERMKSHNEGDRPTAVRVIIYPRKLREQPTADGDLPAPAHRWRASFLSLHSCPENRPVSPLLPARHVLPKGNMLRRCLSSNGLRHAFPVTSAAMFHC